MNDHKPSIFADLTLAELWKAVKMTVFICGSWGVLFGIGYLFWKGGVAGGEVAARWMGFEDGKIPTPMYVGLVILALVIWPGFFANIVREYGKSIGFTVTTAADYWEGSSLFKRIGAAVMLSLLLVSFAIFPDATWVLLLCAVVFVHQMHEVRADREV
jgi:hypothetical protein